MKNKYHRYSFYGLEVELKSINASLDGNLSNPERKRLWTAKLAVEKELKIRRDPYYIPGSKK